jgi:hypothetical protein
MVHEIASYHFSFNDLSWPAPLLPAILHLIYLSIFGTEL